MDHWTKDRRRVWWIAGGAATVAVALGAFGVPLGTILLVGVLLLCPLMMMGMHGGHGGHETNERHDTGLQRERLPSSGAESPPGADHEHAHGRSTEPPSQG